MAYAAAGRFDEAATAAEQALALARRDEDLRVATQIESHLGLFRRRRAVHSTD